MSQAHEALLRFTSMDKGTSEQWQVIGREHQAHQRDDVPGIILDHLKSLEKFTLGFSVDQLHHSLQTATMARRDGASDEMVLGCLCHDIGKVMTIPNHGEVASEILKPYVSENTYKMIRHHQDFQGLYYFNFFGKNSQEREKYKAEPWYDMTCQFIDDWDQAAFDPKYSVLPLEEFEPLVRQFFTKPRPS